MHVLVNLESMLFALNAVQVCCRPIVCVRLLFMFHIIGKKSELVLPF